MNRNKLKAYAPQARRDFIKTVTDRAAFYGLTKDKIEPFIEQGDVAVIGGRPFPIDVAKKRKRLEERIRRDGFEQVMEAHGLYVVQPVCGDTVHGASWVSGAWIQGSFNHE